MMNKLKTPLKSSLCPYLFALKEGKKINHDYLDYSLMLIQVHNSEIIRAPSYYYSKKLALYQNGC